MPHRRAQGLNNPLEECLEVCLPGDSRSIKLTALTSQQSTLRLSFFCAQEFLFFLIGLYLMVLLHSLVLDLRSAQVLRPRRSQLWLTGSWKKFRLSWQSLCPSALAQPTTSWSFHIHAMCSKPRRSLNGQLHGRLWNQVWVLPQDSLKAWITLWLPEQFTMISVGFLFCF